MRDRRAGGGEAIPSEFEIVGVVEDVRFAGLDVASAPAFYVPYRQTPHHPTLSMSATYPMPFPGPNP